MKLSTHKEINTETYHYCFEVTLAEIATIPVDMKRVIDKFDDDIKSTLALLVTLVERRDAIESRVQEQIKNKQILGN